MTSRCFLKIAMAGCLCFILMGCQQSAVTYREIERKELVIGEKGYEVQPIKVRSWVEDIEREGLAPSDIIRLGDSQSISGMCLSADGKTLVFSLVEQVVDELGYKRYVANLRSVSSNGGGITEITSGQWLDVFPMLDESENLYFCSNRLRQAGELDIFRVLLNRTGAIAVIRQTPEGINHQPSVSNSGTMAFTYKPDYRSRGINSSNQIWTLGGENQYPTQLREGEMPAISPDGTEIAFIGPDKQLWKIPVTGQNPVQLTSTTSLGGKKSPTWSPDGRYILYASDEGKDGKGKYNYDIWMIQANGNGMRQLTTNGSLDAFPLVSPDNKYIYFVSNRGFKEGVWRIPCPR